MGEKFKTTDMNASQYRKGHSGIDRRDVFQGKIHREIGLALGDGFLNVGVRREFDIADVGEAFSAEEVFSDMLRRLAGGRILLDAHACRFELALRRSS